ncbi:MAG: translocation/assembly module TamB domain-containing protein [Flavipsychrobacter sp.]|nr:translocation/assembly module TamB domain-containing protein [Flavipsychrobacter sp.]
MRKVLKIAGYTVGSLLLIILLVVVWLNTSSGQEFVRGKAEKFLADKLKTEVRIGKLGYGLPKVISLEDVLFKDQANDTLLRVGKLKINVNMLALISSKVEVSKLELTGVNAHIYRNAPDTAFNFGYIIDAFAGKETDQPEEVKEANDTSSLTFDVNKVELADIRFRFDDYTGGSRFGLTLGKLDLRLREFDPVKMKFHVRDLEVEGLHANMVMDTSYLPPEPEDTTASAPIQLAVDDLKLKDVSFSSDDVLNKMKMGYEVGHLHARPKKIDLAGQVVDIEKLQLQKTTARIWMGKTSVAPAKMEETAKEVADTLEQGNWKVRVADIGLSDIHFAMDNDNMPRQKGSIDYAHLDVKNLALEAKAIVFTGDTIAGNIAHIALSESSGLELRELKTDFIYHPRGAVLNGLFLQTSETILRDYAEVGWPSTEAMQRDPNVMTVKTNLVKSRIGIHDVLLFVPSLASQDVLRSNRNGHLDLEAILEGSLRSLEIQRLFLAGLGSTEVDLSGTLRNVADSRRLAYDLNIVKMASSAADINGFVPRETTAQVRIPDRFGVTGRVSGGVMDYQTPGLTIFTSDGNVYLDGKLLMSPGKGKEQYAMQVRTDKLNIGRILRQDTLMGVVTAMLNATGTGFDMNTMSAVIDASISQAQFKGYDYHSVNISGDVTSKVANIRLNSEDPNARLHINGQADLGGEYVSAKGDINIDSINFQALNLYESELRTRGKIHIDAPELNPDYPNFSLTWLDPLIVANGQRYATDSFVVVSRPSVDSGQNIFLNFDALVARITGHIPLTRAGDVLQEHISRHYSTVAKQDSLVAKAEKSVTDTAIGTYDLSLVADVRDRPILHGILPGLEFLDSIHIEAGLDTRNLRLEATMPRVEYAGTTIENGKATVTGADSSLNYEVTVDRLEQGSLQFWFAKVAGDIRNNVLTTRVSIADSSRTERFVIAANMQQQDNEREISMLPGLKLDYDEWNVLSPNKIIFGDNGFYVQNFGINNSGQSITINSETPDPSAPLNVEMNNFVIGNFTNIISKDTNLANGVLGGKVVAENLQQAPVITGDVQVRNLSVMGDTVGNVSVKANTQTPNTVAVDMKIDGLGNDIALNGNYYTQPVRGNDFDFLLNIRQLDLKRFEGIAQKQIKNSSGGLKGELALKGTTKQPLVNGQIYTDNLVTTISMLNARFKMPSERINFNGDVIDFDQFKIFDSVGNKGTIDGSIALRTMEMNLNVDARNWQVLNSEAKDNDLFYGKLFLTTDIGIHGTPTKPNVDGKVSVLKGTDLTVVSPQSDPTIVSTEGIVEFVNMSDSTQYLPVVKKAEDTALFRLMPGSNINVTLSVDKEAAFSMVIDKATGDFVNVKGEAALNANVGNDGKVTLAGAYTIEDGAYQLNYSFIKRKFRIQPGSTIVFAGDPLDADVNITAVYVANIASYDLVERQVPDPAQLNYYKQRLPFDIQLLLRGKIMQPAITFDIELPEDKVYRMTPDQLELVRSKLAQVRLDTSELTKQVFAVLLLNRFVSDDPFSSNSGGGLAYTAKQSVSRFLGEQLNKFASDLVKGIDISVDLAQSEDYTTGSKRDRTDLSVNASKSLLNDRLRVTIGNDFELQGPQSGNANQNTSYIPGNLAADYNLSTDGRYVVRAYRRAYDEGALQGFVTETGLNFIISMDYNRFAHLFRRNRNRNLKKEQRTEEKKKEVNTAGTTTARKE